MGLSEEQGDGEHRAREVFGDVHHSLCLWHLLILVPMPSADRD